MLLIKKIKIKRKRFSPIDEKHTICREQIEK